MATVCAQVRALALALGLLMQHGVDGWGFIAAQACKPHPPARFWRVASRAEMKLHLLLLMQAIEVRATWSFPHQGGLIGHVKDST